MTDDEHLAALREFLIGQYPQARDLVVELERKISTDPRRKSVHYTVDVGWPPLTLCDEDKGRFGGYLFAYGSTAEAACGKAKEKWAEPFAQAVRRLAIQQRIEAEESAGATA